MATGPGPRPPLIARLSATLAATLLATGGVVAMGRGSGDTGVESGHSTASTVSVPDESSHSTDHTASTDAPSSSVDPEGPSGSSSGVPDPDRETDQAAFDRCLGLLRSGKGKWTVDLWIDPQRPLTGSTLQDVRVPLWIDGCPTRDDHSESESGEPRSWAEMEAAGPQLCILDPDPPYAETLTLGLTAPDPKTSVPKATSGELGSKTNEGNSTVGGEGPSVNDDEQMSSSDGKSGGTSSTEDGLAGQGTNRWTGRYTGFLDGERDIGFERQPESPRPPAALNLRSVTIRIDHVKICSSADLDARRSLGE